MKFKKKNKTYLYIEQIEQLCGNAVSCESRL